MVSLRFQRCCDGFPDRQAAAAQRIDADTDSGFPDGVQIDDAGQALHIGRDEVELFGLLQGLGVADLFHVPVAAAQQFVGAVLHRPGDVGVGGAAAGRVVLEAAVLRGVVAGRDDDAVGLSNVVLLAPVVLQNGPADQRRGRVGSALAAAHVHPVGDQDPQGRGQRRFAEGVGIGPDKQRAVNARRSAVLGHRLRDGEDMALGKRAAQAAAPVAAGAEADLLGRVVHIGRDLVVAGQQQRDVGQNRFGGQLARQFRNRHVVPPCLSLTARPASGFW